MLVNKINTVIPDSKRSISNYSYNRVIDKYSEYLKEVFREYLYEQDINFGDLLKDNDKLIIDFVRDILPDIKCKFNIGLSCLTAFYKYLNKRNIIDNKSLLHTRKLILSLRIKETKLKREDKFLHLQDIHEMMERSKFWFNRTEKYRPDKYDKLKFRAVIYFVYFTGIRRCEIEKIKRSDFDLENCSVKILNRICYYPKQVRDMIAEYFDSKEEINNAFNFTNAVAGRYNKFLSRYKFRGQRLTLSFLRDSNANMIMKRTKNVGLLMKLHGEVSENYIEKYGLKDIEAYRIYKKRIHYQERS